MSGSSTSTAAETSTAMCGGVKWQELYPGMSLVEGSADAQQWSRELSIPFHEAAIETNAHTISLVFADLVVEAVDGGFAPFVVPAHPPEA